MLRDNLVELIEPMLNSAGADPLALYIHTRTPASDDRLPCLKNPRPEGAESSLTESASSPFQAEPAHSLDPSVAGTTASQGPGKTASTLSPTRFPAASLMIIPMEDTSTLEFINGKTTAGGPRLITMRMRKR